MSDRYPSEIELKAIRNWPFSDLRGLVDFVKEIWSDYGIVKVKGRTVTLVTGGWSGNEDIMWALDHNVGFLTCWRASYAGGKHKYLLPKKHGRNHI
jgi:hypothetical protein